MGRERIQSGLSSHSKPAESASLLLLTLALAGVCVASPQNSSQQERLKGLTLEQLGNIEVTTVSKTPVSASRTPAAVYVITQEDIRRSGATSLPDALRLAPGVEVARIDGVKWAIGIRGFQSRLSRNLLVLIDGRTVYSPLFHGVYWEVQETLMEDIERIEVIRGPGGTIWGANAVNGVINVITKDSRETKGALLSLKGGNVDQAALDAREGGGKGSFNYRIYAKAFVRGPEFHSDYRQFDDFRRAQGGFRADWKADAKNDLTVQGDIYDGRDGESAQLTRTSPPSSYILDQNGKLSGGNLMAHWTRDLGKGSELQIQTYYDRVRRLQPNQRESRDTFDVDFVHRWALGDRQTLTWGAGIRFSVGDIPPVVPTLIFNPTHRTDQLGSAFIQHETQLIPDKLSLTVGTKLLHSSYTSLTAEPSARILWTPSSARTVWAGVTRAVRTPSDVEDTLTVTTLQSASPPVFNRSAGDRVFTSETMVGYEAGYRQLIHPQISIDLTAFYNRYDHLLSAEPQPSYTDTSIGATIFPFVNRNGVFGTTKGFELATNWKPRTWWRIQTSYAWLDMNMKAKPDSLDRTTVATLQGSSPAHQVVIQSYIDLPGHFEFTQLFRNVTGLPAQHVAAYRTADLRISWRKWSAWELGITGRNLLQPHHAEFGGDPGPLVGIRRSIAADITWRR